MADVSEFKLFRSAAGLGLRALRNFKKGESLLEYTGRKLHRDRAAPRPNRYLFELNDPWMIDGSPRTNLARYINHSCDPNAQAVHHEDEDRIFIEALRPISVGDEITYNYGDEYVDEFIRPVGCKCSKCLNGQAVPPQAAAPGRAADAPRAANDGGPKAGRRARRAG